MGRIEELRRKFGLPTYKAPSHHVIETPSAKTQSEATREPSSRSGGGPLLPSPLFSILIERMDFTVMDPITFEEIVKTLFECFGLIGTLTPSSGDHGIDIQLRTLEDSLLVVQCKRYAADQVVSPREVREFLGAITYTRAVEGYFVSTSKFSKQCYEFARSQPLYLIDRTLLKELFHQAEAGYRSSSTNSAWQEVRTLIATRSASAQAVAPENNG